MSSSTLSELCNLTTLSWYLSDDILQLKRSHEEILQSQLPRTVGEILPRSHLHDRENDVKEVTSVSKVHYIPNVEEIATEADKTALLDSLVQVRRNRESLQQAMNDRYRICLLKLTSDIKDKTYSIDQMLSLHGDFDFSSSSLAGDPTVSGFNWKTKESIQWWKRNLYYSSQDREYFSREYTSRGAKAASELQQAYINQDLELAQSNQKQLEFSEKAHELRLSLFAAEVSLSDLLFATKRTKRRISKEFR
eukprot:749129-Hanusia_phi.AAC.1